MKADRTRLEGAFTEAPSALSGRVELAFRRGRAAALRRKRVRRGISVAAVLAVLLATIALLCGTALKPRADRVAAQNGGAAGGSLAPGLEQAPGSTPEPTAFPTVGPTPFPTAETTPEPTYTPTPEEAEEPVSGEEIGIPDALDEVLVYYATYNDKYYHLNAHCGGMVNALAWSRSAAVATGKRACPACVSDIEAQPEDAVELVFATPKGRYYHYLSDCSGMRNARLYTLEDAQDMGKAACPVCVAAEEESETE